MDPALDLVLERGSKPLHVTIAEQLAAAIASGALAPGDRLPPERHLAESLGVSRMTVRQALGDLERDGLLRRVVGRAGGTFVAEPGSVQAVGGRWRPLGPAAPSGWRHLGRADLGRGRAGRTPGDGRARPQAVRSRRRDHAAAACRRQATGGRAIDAAGRRFSDIEDMDLSGSLYDLMGDGFGLRPVRAVEKLELVEARPSDVRSLGIRRDAPLLLVERIATRPTGRPVEFARDRFRADRTRLEIESSPLSE